MSFILLPIKLSYDTGDSDPLQEFYLPVLSKSVSYDRIAGFFSSTSLAIAARGISGLISNSGKMRLITSHQLQKVDIDVLEMTLEKPETLFEHTIIKELDELEDSFKKDHIRALGWMVANSLLEIKIALVNNKDSNVTDLQSVFHQKIGIFTDRDGHKVSFSGSINETSTGWLHNIEEFKVFKSWEQSQNQYLEEDVQRFEQLWKGENSNVRIVSISTALKEKLVKIGNNFSNDSLNVSYYFNSNKHGNKRSEFKLWGYQIEAVDKWIKNDHKLLFEMATGTGKTITAIYCLKTAISKCSRLIIIISCPQNTLSRQWKAEIDKIGIKIDEHLFADGSSPKWKDNIGTLINKVSTGFINYIVIYTTHRTGSSKDFVEIISNVSKDVDLCFVGDEVHGLGAKEAKYGLLSNYQYRIGLSATPQRWFDEDGTRLLTDFFGGDSFEFSIKDALKTINPLSNKTYLVQYYYYPIFVILNDNEIESYEDITNKLAKSMPDKNCDVSSSKYYEFLLFARAKIIKDAHNKLDALIGVLDKVRYVNDTIIFTTDTQINQVLILLRQKEVVSHRLTQKEGTTANPKYNGLSERQYIIQKFKQGHYQALVAIKCLDEGIDIPTASTAIIMSSSSNPREFIQRAGRVIRQSEGKERATIYDFIVCPDIKRIKNPSLQELEKKIFRKEIARAYEMAHNSINGADAIIDINIKLGGI